MSAENVGKRVAWNGHKGEIVAFVPALCSLAKNADAGRKVNGGSRRVDAHDLSVFDRYLVRVDQRGVGGNLIAPKWYAPIASTIHRALVSQTTPEARP
jgi:hypothetical protein